MLTTCPECRTTFRVNHDQLEQRRGLVRCGYCQAVFNAYDTLLPEFETAQAEAAGAPPSPNIPQEPPPPLPVKQESAAPDLAPTLPADNDDAFLIPGGTIPRMGTYDEIDLLGQEDRPEPESPLPGLAPVETPDTILLSELPTRSQIEPGHGFWRSMLFGLLSLLLFLLLMAQVLYFLRGTIAVWMPETRPLLEQACRQLGCEVPLSRRLDLIRVESSSLETDPEQTNRAKLKVNFSNRSRQAQAWPAFVLRLSDLQAKPVAQRIFWPRDYLPKGKRESDGMAAMSEFEFQLDLDLGGLSAAGYEIKPQYP